MSTSLAWRWLHHSVAPTRSTTWFARAAAVAALAIALTTALAAWAASRAEVVAAFPAPLLLIVLPASLSALLGFAVVATEFSSLRTERSDELTAFPLRRGQWRALMRVHTIVVQVVLSFVLAPAGAVVTSRVLDWAVFESLAFVLAACATGTLVGLLITVFAANAAMLTGSVGMFAGVGTVSWVGWFTLSGVAGRGWSSDPEPWTLALGWPVLLVGSDAQQPAWPVLVGTLVAALALVRVLLEKVPEIKTLDRALVQVRFGPWPSFVLFLVRSLRNVRVRAQVVAGSVLGLALGCVLLVADGVELPGTLTVFGALFCSSIAAQVRLVGGAVPTDWLLGEDPRATAAPAQAAALVMCLPVLGSVTVLTALSEGSTAAAVAVLAGVFGSLTGQLIATVLRPATGNASGEFLIAMVSLATLAVLLRLVPADAAGVPQPLVLGSIDLIALVAVLVFCSRWDDLSWGRDRGATLSVRRLPPPTLEKVVP